MPDFIDHAKYEIERIDDTLEIIDTVSFEGWHWWERTAADKKEAKWFVENWDTIVAESIENQREENE